MLQYLRGLVLVVLYSFSSMNLTLNAAETVKKFEYKNFTAVDAGWGMHIKITQGNSYSIDVKGDSRDMEYFRAEQKGEKVRFFIDKHNFRSHDEIYITVVMPELKDLNLSAGAYGELSMKTKSDFTGDLSAGSTLKGNLECRNINLDLSAGSSIKLTGKARDMMLDGSAGSIFRLKELEAENAELDLSAGSMAYINCSGTVNTDQSAGSMLYLSGKGKIGNKSLSAGSSIERD